MPVGSRKLLGPAAGECPGEALQTTFGVRHASILTLHEQGYTKNPLPG